MSASLSGLSASVTRILSLTGFAKELKTKDIQNAFSEWENANGGFKIKWRDDTSLLIVFQDAAVAKRAYLTAIASPPAIMTASGTQAVIKPYDGPDAQTVIQTVNARGQHSSNPSRGHNVRSASISVFPSRPPPASSSNANRNGGNPLSGTIPEQFALRTNGISSPVNGREPSPTLPSLPSHPTLNSLISSSLGEAVASDGQALPQDPAIVASSMHAPGSAQGGPRIGDPGKRMVGAALGVRHPGLGPRAVSAGGQQANGGADHAMREVQRAMGGLVVAE
ncbi:hypothetical protein PLICRDRAFT_101975 [Plicaturopsis crispa FD-325 SS-3]|nr:hypothetical protein PLICRDRAFT_101975 [Plicaturopsis crispa FD-325 SS-3]